MADIQPTPACFHLQPRIPGAAAAYMALVLSERIVPVESGCWEWSGSDSRKGYGVIDLKHWDWPESVVLVHRLVYKLCLGPVLDGLHVLHSCDNPPCVNPAHLFVGSNLDNIADKVAKGRQACGESIRTNHGHLKGEVVKTARTNAETVMEIRRADQAGEPQASIASRTGLSTTQVSSIVRGKSWAHLPVLMTGDRKTRECPRCGAKVATSLGRYRTHLESCRLDLVLGKS